MATRLGALILLSTLVSATAVAQDAKTVLQAVSAAMGAGNVKSIQYSGTGWVASVGQSYSADDDYPRFEMTSYTRTIDYEAKSAREELVRTQGRYPPRGGGGSPIEGEQRQVQLVNGNFGWNMQGSNVVPAPAAAEVRQLDIWLTPHGFLKAAMAANNATAVQWSIGPDSVARTGPRKVTFISFTAMGKYRVNGMIDEKNMVERVQTWVANPIFGDMVWEHRFTDYKDFGGVKFPTLVHSHQGDPRLNLGHNSIEVKVSNVQVNLAAPALTVPDAVRQATVPPVRVESQQLAKGVWRIGGGSHNSVAVEFRDFAVVVEAPLNEQRSLAVIAEVQKLIPNKTIRYVVNTHHHADHSGGLRTYLAQGTTIVTHESNREFYEKVLFYPSPRTLEPDRLSSQYPWYSQNRVIPFELVKDKYVISDGERTMDMYPVARHSHAASMLMVYLPAEKILINADLYTPRAPGTQPPPPTTGAGTKAAGRQATRNWVLDFNDNIQERKLDVAQHVPIHGPVGTHADFLKIIAESN